MNKKILLYILILNFSLLLGCSDDNESRADFLRWSESGITAIGNEVTSKVLDCRNYDEYAENIHTYYTVNITDNNLNNKIEIPTKNYDLINTWYPSVNFTISYLKISPVQSGSSSGGGVSMNAAMDIVYNQESGEKTIRIIASKHSLNYFKNISQYQTGVYFQSHEIGSTIMEITLDKNGRKINTTRTAVPGTEFNDEIECRLI